MSASKHPARALGLTKRQVEVFEMIAIGNELPRCHPHILEKLERYGLIRRGPDRRLRSDTFGAVLVPSYFVPLPVHAQWCAWCDEKVSP